MKFYTILLVSVFTFCSAISANANTGSTGWRTVTVMGCHLTDGTCYFNIDGDPVGPEECKGNNVRFNVLTSPNGKTWLSMLEAAYLTKRQVNLSIINTCYADQPVYPTFNYGSIANN